MNLYPGDYQVVFRNARGEQHFLRTSEKETALLAKLALKNYIGFSEVSVWKDGKEVKSQMD